MKTKHVLQTLGLIALGALASSTLAAAPFGSAFTYQGRLSFGGGPAVDGLYDLEFRLYDAFTGGSPLGGGAVALFNVPVSNGVFTVQLSFGSTPFTSGEARWLELSVNTNGAFPLVTLSPRQRLSPTPQAIYAGTAATANGVAAGAVTSAGLSPSSVNSGSIVDGTIDAADLAPSLLDGTFWKLGGNAGTTPGVNFLGTPDNQPLEIKVNNRRALRLEPSDIGPNVIGGGPANAVQAGRGGATISGGVTNRVNGNFGTVSGGQSNTAAWPHTVIGGGQNNYAIGFYAVIGGGFGNSTGEQGATVGGGANNRANGHHSTIAGGSINIADGTSSAIVGGSVNRAPGFSSFVGGGNQNQARGSNSVIVGGSRNITENDAYGAAIGGGGDNRVSARAWGATIAGGGGNVIDSDASLGAIGGGVGNQIGAWSFRSVIAGGELNRIGAGTEHFDGAHFNTISGGLNNEIGSFSVANHIGGGTDNAVVGAVSSVIAGGASNTNSGDYATVPGGRQNLAAGDFSLAAGRRAKANHNGTFVWADDTDANFASTTDKQFAVRANNGVMIQSSATALDLRGGGALRVAGAGVNTATPIFTHRATAANTSGAETRISHPHCDGKPGAILIVTYNFNPAGLAGTRNDRPVGIYYNGGQWAIYNLDGAAMPVGAAYNVLVANP